MLSNISQGILKPKPPTPPTPPPPPPPVDPKGDKVDNGTKKEISGSDTLAFMANNAVVVAGGVTNKPDGEIKGFIMDLLKKLIGGGTSGEWPKGEINPDVFLDKLPKEVKEKLAEIEKDPKKSKQIDENVGKFIKNLDGKDKDTIMKDFKILASKIAGETNVDGSENNGTNPAKLVIVLPMIAAAAVVVAYLKKHNYL